MKDKITLAIETSVGNGSLSLFENDKLLDEWKGESKISRSDRFLPIMDEFLNRNKINKKDLDLIAVSRGPGSFTGARIGLATAVAVKNGLGVECLGISVLRAIVVSSMQTTMQTNLIAAILNDKTQVIWEKFATDSEIYLESSIDSDASRELMSDGAKLLIIDDFINEIKSTTVKTRVLLERRLFELIYEKYDIEDLKTFSENLDFENIGDNLSFYIGRAVVKKHGSDNLSIIYLSADKNQSF